MLPWLLACVADLPAPAPADSGAGCPDFPLTLYDAAPGSDPAALVTGDGLQLHHGPDGGWMFHVGVVEVDPVAGARVDAWVTTLPAREAVADAHLEWGWNEVDVCRGANEAYLRVDAPGVAGWPVVELACADVELEVTVRDPDGSRVQVARLPLVVHLDPDDRAAPSDPCTPSSVYEEL